MCVIAAFCFSWLTLTESEKGLAVLYNWKHAKGVITIKDNACDLLCNCNCIFGVKKEEKSYIPNLTFLFCFVFVSVWLVTLVSCSVLFLFFV